MHVRELVGELPPPLVPDVHGRGRRLRPREEPPLRLEVLLHRAVQVEVVLAQVREDEHVEAHAVEPPQRGTVRARLDGRAAIARIEHLPEEALQVDRLGRRERRGTPLASDLPLDRSRRAPAGGRRPRGSRGAGTPSSSCRSSPSRPRARAPSSARRRTRPPRPPSTRARTERAAAGRRPRAVARRRAPPRRARSPPRRDRGRRRASPRTQKNSAPFVTRRVSYARSPISTGRPPVTSLGARARIRASAPRAGRLEKAVEAAQRFELAVWERPAGSRGAGG